VDDGGALVDAVRALALPDDEGFVWAAGEAATMAALRRVVLDEMRHPQTATRIAAYWKRGVAEHHDMLA
jgi:NADPH-dependent ferric siderophore reductase